LVYLDISRVLDKLVVNYKRSKRLRYTRHYSASDVELEKIEVLEEMLGKFQEESPQTIEILNTDDNVIDELVEMYLKNPGKLEEDLKKDSNVEKRDYKYRILPRIYSDIERISCSPHLNASSYPTISEIGEEKKCTGYMVRVIDILVPNLLIIYFTKCTWN
jgi:hypothetical protein